MLGFRTQMPWSSSAQASAQEQLCEGTAAVVAARQGMETPLKEVAVAFEELARGMEADDGELRLAPFGETCALVSVLFSSLGMAFRFAEIEYVTKVSHRRLRPDDLFSFPQIVCFACARCLISGVRDPKLIR